MSLVKRKRPPNTELDDADDHGGGRAASAKRIAVALGRFPPDDEAAHDAASGNMAVSGTTAVDHAMATGSPASPVQRHDVMISYK